MMDSNSYKRSERLLYSYRREPLTSYFSVHYSTRASPATKKTEIVHALIEPAPATTGVTEEVGTGVMPPVGGAVMMLVQVPLMGYETVWIGPPGVVPPSDGLLVVGGL